MGVLGFTVMDVVRCMMLVGVLFAGPLFERVFVEREVEVSWRRWTGLASDWIVWRNFVVGPVSEEIIFRAVNVSLMLYVQVSGVVFLSDRVSGANAFGYV